MSNFLIFIAAQRDKKKTNESGRKKSKKERN
jgi:hypothetical protein